MDKQCGVRIYEAAVRRKCGGEGLTHTCEGCRIGCFAPARHRNPFFGKEFAFDMEKYWWRAMYTYTEWLCAEHCDRMIAECRETEDFYRDHDPNYEECLEFTKVLETL